MNFVFLQTSTKDLHGSIPISEHVTCNLFMHVLSIENKACINVYDMILQMSCRRGYKKTVTLLLENRANIHADHHVALTEAIDSGNKDLVSLLSWKKS
jgi:hypothetical protein